MEITIRISIFCLLSFLAFHCQNQEHTQNPIPAGFDIYQYRKEALKVSEIKINNAVPFLMNREQFYQIFGQEDSIITAPQGLYTSFMIMDTIPAICRYICKGRSVFLEKGPYVYPLLLDLGSTPVSLNSDSVLLNLNTSIKDINHRFPMSSILYKSGDGNEFGGIVAIDATHGNQGTSMWHLLFQGGFLVKIVFYTHPKRPFFDDFEARKKYNEKK